MPRQPARPTETAPIDQRPASRGQQPRPTCARSIDRDARRTCRVTRSWRPAGLNVYYGDFHAVHDVNLVFGKNEITALIGPSGCGKSTVLRCLNRMNDLVPGRPGRGRGQLPRPEHLRPRRRPDRGTHATSAWCSRSRTRSRSRSTTTSPTAAGHRHEGRRHGRPRRGGLHGAALWDEVKDKLKQSAYGLSGGQQQRLCIARTIATKPDVILMDEPCSALDPIATARIEDLMLELTRGLHDHHRHPQHAAGRPGLGPDRVLHRHARRDHRQPDRAARRVRPDQARSSPTPRDQRTEDYISGRFG